MKILNTPIADVHIVESAPIEDHRGSFSRIFCANELAPVIGNRQILQANHATTKKTGSIRGLHFQRPPHAEIKMIRCLRGRIWDVALDLRAESSTFGEWHAVELTPENNRMIIIPERCAHGLQILEPDSEVLYLHTAFYEPSSEGGIRYDDPRFAIEWPFPATEISDRDMKHSWVGAEFKGIPL